MASPIDKLVHALSRLPGIGEKTATRLAFFILGQDSAYAQELSQALGELHQKVGFCSQCQNLTQEDPCRICANADRDDGILLVVETPQDLLAVEKSRSYRGKYHVLHGVISPLDGVTPEDLQIAELLTRVKSGLVREVILGTNPDVEGEATALYLGKLIGPLQIKITRLASGMPVGSGIEYLDPLTLQKALEGRTPIL
jgi:recombination protein RecR